MKCNMIKEMFEKVLIQFQAKLNLQPNLYIEIPVSVLQCVKITENSLNVWCVCGLHVGVLNIKKL